MLSLVVLLFSSAGNAQEYKLVSLTRSPLKQGVRFPNFFGNHNLRGSLADLLRHAYGERGFRTVEGPEWIHTDGWDLRFETEPANTSLEEDQKVLLRILESRFVVKAHREKKVVLAYRLTQTATDSQLQRVAPSAFNGLSYWREGSIRLDQVWMKSFTEALSWRLNRAVLDKTSLTGFYRFAFDWTPSPASPDTAFFEALEQHTGLRLESCEELLDVIVVEGVEKPRVDGGPE